MTIYLYSGTPGSGKSLHAARDIYDNLKYGKRPVVANFPINPDTKGFESFTYIDNYDISPSFLEEYAHDHWTSGARFHEDGILLILDECQLVFNSRDWNAKGRMDWLRFFSQHRKYGYKVILIAQFDRMLDRQIRGLIEYDFIHRRMGNFGKGGKAITFLTLGELYVCVKQFYPLKEKVGQEFFRGKKKYYRLYDSYGTFSKDGPGVEGRGLGGPRPDAPRLSLGGFVPMLSKLKAAEKA